MEEAVASLKTPTLDASALAQTPSLPPFGSCVFMDKIPAEIRLKIFRLATRADCALSQFDAIAKARFGLEPVLINTALFTVCRQVSEEALEAFFDVNTIRARTLNVIAIARFAEVRHLEFAGKAALKLCRRHPMTLSYLAEIFGHLHKLKSVTVICDTLTQDGRKTVRSLFTGQSSNATIRCLDIGLFEVKPAVNLEDVDYTIGRIVFKHSGLRAVVPQAKRYAVRYKLAGLVEATRGYWNGNVIQSTRGRDIAKLDCAAWFLKYEITRSLREGDSSAWDGLSDYEKGVVQLFEHEVPRTSTLPLKQPLLPCGVKMQDLTQEEHGSELLEWATELLSLNVWTATDRDHN